MKLDAYKNIPNYLTLLRIILVPILVLVFYFPLYKGHTIAAVVFAVACVTDYLDGYLARRLHVSSAFGAFLDPVADKVIVVIALMLLVSQPRLHWVILAALVIVAREIIVSGLREWMAEVGKRAHVAVSVIGKWKTACQMVSIIILLYSKPLSTAWVMLVGLVLIYIAAVLTVWSMVMYLKAALPEMIRQRES